MHDDPEVHQAVEAELARLAAASTPARFARTIGYWASRALVRLLRILLGVGLAAAALWCGSVVVSLFSQPIAALTLGNLVQLALALLGTFATGIGALVAAFGPINSDPDPRAQVATAVRERLHRKRAEATEIAILQDQAAKWYRHGRLVGILFDRSLARRHKWLPIVSVLAAYVMLGLGIALLSRCNS